MNHRKRGTFTCACSPAGRQTRVRTVTNTSAPVPLRSFSWSLPSCALNSLRAGNCMTTTVTARPPHCCDFASRGVALSHSYTVVGVQEDEIGIDQGCAMQLAQAPRRARVGRGSRWKHVSVGQKASFSSAATERSGRSRKARWTGSRHAHLGSPRYSTWRAVPSAIVRRVVVPADSQTTILLGQAIEKGELEEVRNIT